MYHNTIFKNQQKGVSLIITFFILTIILAVVLSISILLYGQVKIIRNIGDSVVAFYAADSGVEKVLYYDRKQIPTGGTGRGICNIVNICSGCDPNLLGDCQEVNCYGWQPITGSDCNPLTCSNCHIGFSSQINSSKSYNIDIVVNQQCKKSSGTISSYGFYKDVSRAIRLDSKVKVIGFPPVITGPNCVVNGGGGGNNGFTVQATVSDSGGQIVVIATIKGEGTENQNNCKDNGMFSGGVCTYREITLTGSGGGGTYSKPWNANKPNVIYTVTIMATDSDGNCVEVPACTITT